MANRDEVIVRLQVPERDSVVEQIQKAADQLTEAIDACVLTWECKKEEVLARFLGMTNPFGSGIVKVSYAIYWEPVKRAP